MPNTGRFHLIEVRGDVAPRSGRLTHVSLVVAFCHQCGSRITVVDHKGLQSLKGGTAITCPNCKARQAISNALFDDFLAGEAN